MIRIYGFLGFFRVLGSFIYTKLVFPQARLIRLPFDIRNRRYVNIGKGFTTGFSCRIEVVPSNKTNKSCIKIGENVQINDFVHIGAVESITIEDNVLIASKVYISDHNHGGYDINHSSDPNSDPIKRLQVSKPVKIKKNVWIGESVCILPGVTIGKGSIIGALSVVTKDIPDYTIAVGSPAKPIKKYNFETKKWERI